MKSEPYTYKTSKGEQTVQAYTMMDVNKAVMRCLVKNLAMFGLGIAIYAGEDLPDDDDPVIDRIKSAQTEEELTEVFKSAVKEFMSNNAMMIKLAAAKDARKKELK
jgi:hypothetical protein